MDLPAPLPDGKGGLALSPEPLPQKGFLWFSAEVLLHEGAFERLEQRRAPLDVFLLAIDFVNEGSEGILEREWWEWATKSFYLLFIHLRQICSICERKYIRKK